MTDLSVADSESSPKVDKISLFDRLFNDNSQMPPTTSGFLQTPFGLTMDQFAAGKHQMMSGEGSLLLIILTVKEYIIRASI